MKRQERSLYFILSLYFSMLILSVIFAYSRKSGSTGLDVVTIHRLRQAEQFAGMK